MLPPTWVSKTVSAISTSSRLCSGGLNVPKPSVKTEKARSIGASTTIECCVVVSDACVLIRSPSLVLDGRLVGGERLVPEVVEVSAQQAQSLGIDLVDAPGADSLVDDQPGVLEHLQVLRDGGPADRQLPGQLTDRPGPLGQVLEDRPPGRIA